MGKYLLDSFALIEYLEGTETGEKVKEIIQKEQNEILISAISVSEILSKVLRQNLDKEKTKKIILSLGKIIDVNIEIAELASEIHAQMKKKINDFGLADALILASTKLNNAKLVTGDKHFKDMKDIVFL
mgnify:FL=1